jgi:hypothetical protein
MDVYKNYPIGTSTVVKVCKLYYDTKYVNVDFLPLLVLLGLHCKSHNPNS